MTALAAVSRPGVAPGPRTLPHNLEAERSVLGAVLIENAVFDTAARIVTPREFFRQAHGKVFRSIAGLLERNEPADLVTLKEDLERRGELEDVGGPAFIASLVDGVPRSTNIEYYARIVKDKAALRAIIAAATRIQSQAFEADEPDAIIGEAIASLEQSRDCSRDPLPMLTLEQVLAMPAAQPVIAPWIFERSLAIMAGHPGAGKSTVAVDLALCIATGQDWHGYRVSSAGAVLFIDAEGSLRARSDAWCRAKAVDPAKAQVYAVPQAVPFHDRASVRSLVSSLRAIDFRPVLVVVDTLARCSAGIDENGSEGFGRIIDSCAALINDLGAAVLLIHHFRKGGAGDEGELRGHSSLRGAADTILVVHGNPADGLTVKPDKQRHTVIGESLRLRAVPVDHGGIILRRTEDVLQDNLVGVGETQAKLLAALVGFGERGATFNEWLTVSGLPRSTFNRQRASLLQRGLVREKQHRYQVSGGANG